MVKLIILFRTGSFSDAYNKSYNNFLVRLEALPGLRKKAVSTVYGATGGQMPYTTVVEAYFDSRAAMEKALLSPEGIEAGHLLRDFAGRDTLNLFADTLEESYSDAG